MGSSLSYKIGTMIEIPRAALVADEVRQPFIPCVPGTTDNTQQPHSLVCSALSSFLPWWTQMLMLEHIAWNCVYWLCSYFGAINHRLQRRQNSSPLGPTIWRKWRLATAETTSANSFLFTCPKASCKLILSRSVPHLALQRNHLQEWWERLSKFHNNPNFSFLQVLDRRGVGQLIKIATERGRAARPNIKVIGTGWEDLLISSTAAVQTPFTVLLCIFWLVMNSPYMSDFPVHRSRASSYCIKSSVIEILVRPGFQVTYHEKWSAEQ